MTQPLDPSTPSGLTIPDPPPQPPYPVQLPPRLANAPFAQLPGPMQRRVLEALAAAEPTPVGEDGQPLPVTPPEPTS